MGLKLKSSAGGSVTLEAPTTLTTDSTVYVPLTAIPSMQAFVFTGEGATQYFTVPAGVTKIRVTVVGGGGGGYGATGGAGGGGGGGTAIKVISGLTSGSQIGLIVGKGGAIGVGGTTSSFGTYCSASGGDPGTIGAGGIGGQGSGGDLMFNGGGGSGGNNTYNWLGSGGSSFYGGGGRGGSGGSSGSAGGGGGGGGGGNQPGSNGLVVVEW